MAKRLPGLTVNRRAREDAGADNAPLVDHLRDTAGLTASKQPATEARRVHRAGRRRAAARLHHPHGEL